MHTPNEDRDYPEPPDQTIVAAAYKAARDKGLKVAEIIWPTRLGDDWRATAIDTNNVGHVVGGHIG